MSQRKLSAEKLQEIRELAASWGKSSLVAPSEKLDRIWGVDLTAMEEIAATAACGLTESTLSILLQQQAGCLDAEQPCPDCGLLCPVRSEDRPLAVKGGRLLYHEPVCHCPDCRRNFFPPTDFPASG